MSGAIGTLFNNMANRGQKKGQLGQGDHRRREEAGGLDPFVLTETSEILPIVMVHDSQQREIGARHESQGSTENH